MLTIINKYVETNRLEKKHTYTKAKKKKVEGTILLEKIMKEWIER